MGTSIGDGLFSNPYTVPTATDRGSEIFDAMEDYLTRMATHSHDGINSKNITVSVNRVVTDIAPSWTDGTTEYYFTATLSAGANTSGIHTFYMKDGSEYKQVMLRSELVSLESRQIKIYSNAQIADIRIVSI